MAISCWSNALMVTLTKHSAHAILLRFMMLITKVNVNIARMRSRSTFLFYRLQHVAGRIAYDPFTSAT
ncbi:MAG TPA: hypothetical protein DC012_13380 [Escherichia sp.]|nr:hypothetical protein [Escherichia sp.]